MWVCVLQMQKFLLDGLYISSSAADLAENLLPMANRLRVCQVDVGNVNRLRSVGSAAIAALVPTQLFGMGIDSQRMIVETVTEMLPIRREKVMALLRVAHHLYSVYVATCVAIPAEQAACHRDIAVIVLDVLGVPEDRIPETAAGVLNTVVSASAAHVHARGMYAGSFTDPWEAAAAAAAAISVAAAADPLAYAADPPACVQRYAACLHEFIQLLVAANDDASMASMVAALACKKMLAHYDRDLSNAIPRTAWGAP